MYFFNEYEFILTTLVKALLNSNTEPAYRQVGVEAGDTTGNNNSSEACATMIIAVK